MGLDLRGAFNLVEHSRLVIRTWDLLRSTHFSESECAWLTLFVQRWLNNRTTFYNLAPKSQKLIKVRRGCPQGAALSSILFVIYFQFEVDEHITCTLFIYADDGSLHIYALTWSEIAKITDIILEKIKKWCAESDMELAPQKCWLLPLHGGKEFPVALKTLNIKLVTSARLLGVILDSRMCFNLHLAEIRTFWNFRIKIIFLVVKLGLSFFKALNVLYSIRSKLFFGIYWWKCLAKTNQEKIEIFWRKGIRTIAQLSRSCPLEDFMKALTIPTMTEFIVYLMTKRELAKIENDYRYNSSNSSSSNNNNSSNSSNNSISNSRYSLRENRYHHSHDQNSNLIELQVKNEKEKFLKSESQEKWKDIDGFVFRMMFGRKVDKNTDLKELIKICEEKNSYEKNKKNNNKKYQRLVSPRG